MSAISDLILIAAAYGHATNLERSTVSWRVFGDGKKLDALIGGADIQVRRHEAAMRWLSGNWPDGAIWPPAVMRPLISNDHDASPTGEPGLPDAPADDATVAPGAAAGAGKSDRNIPRTEAVS